jgi:hypothetical protein
MMHDETATSRHTTEETMNADDRIAALEARLAALEESASSPSERHDERRENRRNFLKLAGAAAAGVVGASAMRPAAAADTDSLVIGAANTGALSTRLTSPTLSGIAFAVTNSAASSDFGDAVYGLSSGASNSYGVRGRSEAGYGVIGESNSGYSLYAGALGRIGSNPHISSGPPTSGNYRAGDIIRDLLGNYWCCVVGDGTGVGTWRKLAGPATAGQLHLLPAPVRAFDSRASEVPGNAAQGGLGPFINGTQRTVSLALNAPGTATPLVPAGATAALVTVAVFQISGEGFMTLYRNGTSAGPTINAYWGNIAGNQVATLTAVALDAGRQFIIRSTIAGGPSVSAAIDVVGYYL